MALEALRQPLEDGEVLITRVNASLKFPSRMILVASMNPCPCGYKNDRLHECTCTDYEIKRYNTQDFRSAARQNRHSNSGARACSIRILLLVIRRRCSAVIRQRVEKSSADTAEPL